VRATENSTALHVKQRLRVELNRHIEDFLHKGGSIEKLNGLDGRSVTTHARRWPTAGYIDSLPGVETD